MGIPDLVSTFTNGNRDRIELTCGIVRRQPFAIQSTALPFSDSVTAMDGAGLDDRVASCPRSRTGRCRDVAILGLRDRQNRPVRRAETMAER